MKLTNINDFSEEINKNKTVVVYLYKTDCRYCDKIKPYYKKYRTKEHKYIKVDMDIFSKFLGIDSTPTFLFIKNGKVVTKITGADKKKLKKTFEKF